VRLHIYCIIKLLQLLLDCSLTSRGVAETMANASVYIRYFNLSAEVDSQGQSELNSSYSLSQSMSQDSQEADKYDEMDEVKAQKNKLLYFQASLF